MYNALAEIPVPTSAAVVGQNGACRSQILVRLPDPDDLQPPEER